MYGSFIYKLPFISNIINASVFKFIFTILFGGALWIFIVANSFFNTFLDVILFYLSRAISINSIFSRFIFFLFTSIWFVIIIFLIIPRILKSRFVYNLIQKDFIRHITITSVLLVSLIFLFACFISLLLLFKLLSDFLILPINANIVARKLIDIDGLRSSSYSLIQFTNYFEISTDIWDKIWLSIINNVNDSSNILFFKNAILTEYNLLVKNLNTLNFSNLINNLNNVDYNDIQKLKDIFSSDVIKKLSSVWNNLNALDYLLLKLKSILNINDFNMIYKSLGIINDPLNFESFLINIKNLNIKGSSISSVLLDDNGNIILDNNLGILIFILTTGVFINNINGFDGVYASLMNGILFNYNDSLNLKLFFTFNIVISIIIFWLTFKYIIDHRDTWKELFLTIIKLPRTKYRKDTFDVEVNFIDWYFSVLKVLKNITKFIFIEVILGVLIIYVLKIFTDNNINFVDPFDSKKLIIVNIIFIVILLIVFTNYKKCMNIFKKKKKLNAKNIKYR